MAKCFIGTSGWVYPHWKGTFYPEELKEKDKFSFFVTQFNTVEINTTFYHLPLESTVKNWYKQAPSDFIFSVKASGYITHRKRLLEPEKTLELFFTRMRLLGKKLGPILFQLPPSFQQDLERLKNFINHLPKGIYTFEFRHPSWYTQETLDLLSENNIALCITDLKNHPSPEAITASHAYIRLHGPLSTYSGKYGPRLLKIWQKKVKHWMSKNIDVYCYFDNDEKAYATVDAKMLLELLH